MSYVIKRSGKRVPKSLNIKFESYDKARQAVRKWLLRQIVANRLPDNSADYFNRTVSIGKYGFSVVAV